MKRKKSIKPTKVYQFSCSEPLTNADVVNEQIRLARKYRNKLVEIEIQRRDNWRKISGATGDVVALTVQLHDKQTEIENVRTLIEQEKIKSRKKRTPEIVELRAKIKELSAECKKLREAIKDARYGNTKSDLRTGFFAQWINKACNTDIAEARAASGLYWGTYLLVEKSHEQIRKSHMDPEFKRWDGSGRIGVQFQKGIHPKELEDDTRIQVTGIGKHRKLNLRIGTVEGKREAIWASFKVVWHRELPPDADIKWAWVQRKRVGAHWHWHFYLVLEADFEQPKLGEETIAIDVGWRLRDEDNTLRVGYFYDTKGNHGEITLPGGKNGPVSRLMHSDKLRQIQSLAFDEHRDILVDWMKNNTVPQWLTDATTALHLWKSANRLSRVIVEWRNNRFAGDQTIFALMETWRKQNKHLNEWELNQRHKIVLRRLDFYRKLAADLSVHYKTVVFEKFDLRSMQDTSESEKDDITSPIKYRQSAACVHKLRLCIQEKIPTVFVKAAHTTTTCSKCGADMGSPGASLLITCQTCGIEWDQDHNAARNILALWSSGKWFTAAKKNASGSEASDSQDALDGSFSSDNAGLSDSV